MDSSSIGIKAKMQEFERILKKCDKELWEHLLNLKINSQFYSLRLIYLIVGMYNYRWILLYFTQEFELFDVLRLWDTILTYEDKTTFVLYVCVAIL